MNYVIKKHGDDFLLKRNVSHLVWEYYLVEYNSRHERGWYKKEDVARIGLEFFLSDNREDLNDIVSILEGEL